jgi:cellulose synthase/poly-beta-1,6-N-acetylglucosamine synthase-like glycosyltransferase
MFQVTQKYEEIFQTLIKARTIMTPTPVKRRIAMLVPGWNEERVIGETLTSLLQLVPAEDIYVVDDGSKDNTSVIAKQYVPNVLTLNPNSGKATAMNRCIQHFQLDDRYEYIMPMDADTKVTAQFLEATLPILDTDTKKKVCAVVGKVIGRSKSWVTIYRLWEYEVAQTIHKAAQSKENAVIVCPGCATVYRAEIFQKVLIPTGTLTEDMDFTFLMHRQKMGKIVYTGRAVVVTQDPLRMKDLVKQIDRWYTGFWQCVIKHNIPWGGQMLDVEVGMLATEGIFNGMLVLSLIVLIPFALINHPSILVIPFLMDLVFFLVPTMTLTALRHKSWKIFVFIPHFYVARMVSCMIFLKCFVKVLFGADLGMGWFQATRYQIES